MTRVLTGALLLASAATGTWIWTDLDRTPAITATAALPLPAPRIAAAGQDAQRRSDEAALILARPLFSPSRRPAKDAASPAPAAPITTLPRMTAILIDGSRRSAIFEGDGKPSVLGEGDRLGPFTIQSIEPQQVIITGPEGKRTVRTAFSNAPPPAPPGNTTGIPQAMPYPSAPVILPPGMPLPGMPKLVPPR